MPLYRENAERSNIKTVLHGSINNPPILFLNHDYDYENEGSVWQQLVSDSRFGSAIASAIDKEDVNNTLYFGRYTLDGFTKETFDPEASNRLLDAVGMTKRDPDGFRTDPNGDRFELTITTAEISPDFLGLGELLKNYFESVGIRTTLDVIGNSLFGQRMNGNELMATIHWSDEPIWAPGISEDYWPGFKGHWAPMSEMYFNTKRRIWTETLRPTCKSSSTYTWLGRSFHPQSEAGGSTLRRPRANGFRKHYVTIWAPWAE